MRGRAQLCVTGSLPSGSGRAPWASARPRALPLPLGPDGDRRGRGGTMSVSPPQSQQPPPPVQHLPKPRGEATLKMRASVRMTRYLESWGAARPFAHLSHRESLSSGGTPVPHGRRPKVGPGGRGLREAGPEGAGPEGADPLCRPASSLRPGRCGGRAGVWGPLPGSAMAPSSASPRLGSVRVWKPAAGAASSTLSFWTAMTFSSPLQAIPLRRHRTPDR